MTNDTVNREAIECENHPGQQAVGACAVCGKPLCGDCALSIDKAVLCDREHQKILTDWTTVFACGSEFEADALQRNLESVGIRTRVFSSRDHLTLYWKQQHAPVRVMVQREEAEKAVSTIEGLELKDYARND
ncbi:MAG: B-box zinc finger protein [Bacteroidota bacterium]